jgi:hypothetical protein
MSDIIDLDRILKPEIEAAIKATKYVKIKVFGKEWRLSTSPNIYTSLAGGSGDVEALAKMLVNIVHEEDRSDFKTTLMDAEGVSAEVLLALLNGMMEAVADRPTKSPSGSSTGRKRTQVTQLKSEDD